MTIHQRPASLNAFAAEIHRDNAHWWHDPATGERLDRNKGEMFMLMVSELSECMEGERKDLMDDHLPHRKMAEVELADTVIRIMDYSGSRPTILNLEYAFATDWVIPENKSEALHEIVAVIANVTNTEWWRMGRAVNMIEAYATRHGYDLWGAVAEKRAYNATRADHKAEARLAAGGKRW